MQHTSLWGDEAGFIISAELVLVASILVIGIIVGLSEIQHAVVSEMNDVADAVGSLNQSYWYSGFSKIDGGWSCDGSVHAFTRGSSFVDTVDACDNNQCDISCDVAVPEGPKPKVHGKVELVPPSKQVEQKSRGAVDEIRRHLHHDHKHMDYDDHKRGNHKSHEKHEHDHKAHEHDHKHSEKAPPLPRVEPKKGPMRKRDAA